MLIAALSAPARADDAAGKLGADEAALFRWWDGLGYPDVTRLPFVRVWTGWWEGESNGFLLSDEGSSFRVFLTDLRVARCEKSPTGVKPSDRVGFERADLPAFVERALENPELPLDERASPRHEWPVLDWHWRLPILARACAAQGREDLAIRLLARVEKRAAQDGAWPSRPPPRYAWVRDDLSLDARRAFQRAFHEPGVSWAERLAEARRFRANFLDPKDSSTHDDEGVLEAMAREESAGGSAVRVPAKEGDDAAHIAGLVHDLQEVRFRGFGESTGWTEERDVERPERADVRLAALGRAAVPALLSALADERFTRSVIRALPNCWFVWEHPPRYRALRVRDLAWNLLNRASAGYLSAANPGAWTTGDPKLRAAAERWWAEAGAGREVSLLAEAVSKGEWGWEGPAKRLAALSPSDAVRALEAGIAATTQHNTVLRLVGVLSSIEGDLASEALLRLSRARSEPGVVGPIAWALWSRGHVEGRERLLDTWRRLAGPPPEGNDGVLWDLRASTEFVVGALVASGDAEAIEGLAEGLSSRSGEDRLTVVRAAIEPTSTFGLGLYFQEMEKGEPTAREPTVAASRALVGLLADRLEDAERVWGCMRSTEGLDPEPIVGEFAAWGLSRRFPERWAFDPAARPSERERARLVAANAWRTRRGRCQIPAACAPASPGRSPSAAASEVVAVRMEPGSHPGGAAVLCALADAVGKPLTGSGFLDLVFRGARALPSGVAGLQLRAVRDGPSKGIVVSAVFVKDPLPRSGFDPRWQLDGPMILAHSSMWDGSRDHLSSPVRDPDGHYYEEEVDEALAAPLDAPVSIWWSLVRER